MELFSLARHFTAKILYASNTNLFHFNEIATAGKNLLALKDKIKNLAGGDPYTETDLESGFSKLKETIEHTTDILNRVGLNPSGLAGFYRKIDDGVKDLESSGIVNKFDQDLKGKLDLLKDAVSAAESNYVPVGIGALSPIETPELRLVEQKPTLLPETVITKSDALKEDEEPEGMAYSPDSE